MALLPSYCHFVPNFRLALFPEKAGRYCHVLSHCYFTYFLTNSVYVIGAVSVRFESSVRWRYLHVLCNYLITCVLNKANLRDLIAATGLVISNWIQIVNFSARVTVKFDGWPCKTIGHLFYATSSFVHHFVAIGEFKLQLQSGNAQSGSNSTIFRGVRPWNLTDDLQNNRAPLLCYFKLSTSFRSHWWIKTWVTVRKRPIWVKFDVF